MLNFLVGWVRLTECQSLAIDPVILPDHVCIAKYPNPTPDLTLSSQEQENANRGWQLDFLVGWVRLTECQLLAIDPVILPDHVCMLNTLTQLLI